MTGNPRAAVRNQLLLDALGGPVDTKRFASSHHSLDLSFQRDIDGYRTQPT